MAYDLSNYEQVDNRLKRFMDDFKDSRVSVVTELVLTPPTLKGIIFKATITVFDLEGNVVYQSTGWANEVPGDGPVNKDSVVENCETSAVGRALANLAYSGAKRPSAQEMQKVGKSAYAEAPKPAVPKPAAKEQRLDEVVGSAALDFVYPFGKAKGQSALTCSTNDLNFLIKAAKESIDDPSKSRFKESNQAMLVKAQAILASRG